VELIRFSLYLRLDGEALIWTAAGLFVFLTLASVGYSPAKGMMPRKMGGAGGE
jgi:ABC-2 type transport system permease protein